MVHTHKNDIGNISSHIVNQTFSCLPHCQFIPVKFPENSGILCKISINAVQGQYSKLRNPFDFSFFFKYWLILNFFQFYYDTILLYVTVLASPVINKTSAGWQHVLFIVWHLWSLHT